MKVSFLKSIFLAAFAIFSLSACSDDENNTTPQSKPTYDMTGFAKGADVSWLTEMEKAGSKFYNASGAEQDCMTLLRDLGVNSIRLRVWVDPQDGWSGKQDVLAKAWRAKNLGQRIMIDFHYSDSWADPGKQNIPAAWTGFKDDLQKMKAAVAEHTTDVLSFLKENGIDVEWIQIGNETTTGMLWPLGLASDNNFANYAALNNAGYDAAKAVYPDAQCIHRKARQQVERAEHEIHDHRIAEHRAQPVALDNHARQAEQQSEADQKAHRRTGRRHQQLLPGRPGNLPRSAAAQDRKPDLGNAATERPRGQRMREFVEDDGNRQQDRARKSQR